MYGLLGGGGGGNNSTANPHTHTHMRGLAPSCFFFSREKKGPLMALRSWVINPNK